MQTLYTVQDDWGKLCAAAVLEIKAVPAKLTTACLGAVLTGCEQPGTTAELCFTSVPGRRGAVQLMLILGQSGGNPYATGDGLRRRRDAVADRLEGLGFVTASLDGETCYAFSRSMAARRDVTLFYPGESLRRVRFCYAPGGYDALTPLNLNEVVGVIANHESAGFSVQMNAARLLPEEERAIRDNLAWLDGLSGEPEVPQAARAFSAALSLRGEPAFFINITAWGDETAMGVMLPVLRQSGLVARMLPQGLLARADYLTQGPALLSDFTATEAHVLEPVVRLPTGCRRLTHMASRRLVEVLLMPRGTLDAPRGLTVNRLPRDNAPLPAALTGEGVALGRRAGDGTAVAMPLDRWARHAVVVGMPGTGKTTFLFHLLLELNRLGVPFLAVEPTKTEYRALMDAIPDLRVYTPGNSGVAPLMFNPFLPPRGVTLEKFLPNLETAFLTAFSMHSPLDVIFSEVLRTCYTRYGWRMDSTIQSPGVRPFGMRQFIEVFREEARQSGYDGESRANLESGGVYRFQSLLNNNPVLYDTDRPLPTDELLKRPVLIELDAIGNPEQKSLLLSMLLIQLNLVIRRDQLPDGKLKNAIMLDEAHVLLGQAGGVREARDADPTGRAVALLQQMVLENRAYGSGMIFADQSPDKLGAQIVGNADIQLVFRLNSAADRRVLGENMNLPRQLVDAIEALDVGQCYLQAQGLEQPVRLVTPDVRATAGLKATLPDEAVRHRYGAVPAPFDDCPCASCSIADRNTADYIARSIVDRRRRDLADPQRAENFIRSEMMALLDEAVAGQSGSERLPACAKLHLVRHVDAMLTRLNLA